MLFASMDWRELRKPAVTMAPVPAETQTLHLSKANLECLHFWT